jgi:hypothetical protein
MLRPFAAYGLTSTAPLLRTSIGFASSRFASLLQALEGFIFIGAFAKSSLTNFHSKPSSMSCKTAAMRRYSMTCSGCHWWASMCGPIVSTSFVERSNLSIRVGNRRMTRLTNAFSKKAENHAHMMAIYFIRYNFVRIHQTLRVTPAMDAGVSRALWSLTDMVRVIEKWEIAPRLHVRPRPR